MAVVFKLRRVSTDVNLNAAANAGLRFERWYPAAATPVHGRRAAPVTEVVDLIADSSSDDALATALQALDNYRVLAARYINDPTEENPVWLHAKMSAETGERRALVRKIEMDWLTSPIEATGYGAASTARLRLRIEREPWWEDTSGRTTPAMSETAGASLAWDYTGGGSPHDVVGDTPARIQKFAIGSDATGAHVGRLWMGLRSANKHGTLANFIRVWECEDGANNASESGITDEVDATASGEDKVQVVETDLDWDNTWHEVLEIELRDISANTTDQFGSFLWLQRCKVSAGTWEVQGRFGYSGMADDDYVRGPIVELTETAWEYKEMGHQMIPVGGHTGYSSDERRNAVQIWGRRTAGAGNLELDCLCPVPTDEGWAKIWNVDLAAGSSEWLAFYEDPDGDLGAFEYDATSITALGIVAASNFALPVGDGLMFIIYAGPTDSDITTGGISVLALGNAYFERWANLRGAE